MFLKEVFALGNSSFLFFNHVIFLVILIGAFQLHTVDVSIDDYYDDGQIDYLDVYIVVHFDVTVFDQCITNLFPFCSYYFYFNS